MAARAATSYVTVAGCLRLRQFGIHANLALTTTSLAYAVRLNR
ncbi:MAG: hypothetical protein SNJ67_03700 [Chloracidobacterium sp.]|nr:hypothetical protein [Chloracidobacterium validum]